MYSQFFKKKFNEIVSPETNSNIYSHLIFDKWTKIIQRRKKTYFQEMVLELDIQM